MSDLAKPYTERSWYFEDFDVGLKLKTASKTVTDTDVVLSVGLTGHFQPIFVDDEFAKKTHFGSRIAPGELTIGILAGLLSRKGILENQVGLLEILCKFPQAVKPGDTLRAETEIMGTKLNSSGRSGIVTFRDLLFNQRNEIVLETNRVAMFLSKNA